MGEIIQTVPDISGDPVVTSCVNCNNCFDDSDGPEYGPVFYGCDKNPHMANLKGFPFKTPQKCFEIHFAYLL